MQKPHPFHACFAGLAWGEGEGCLQGHSAQSCMASSLQASALLLKHPETGLHCVPLVRTALSLNLLHPEHITWISQDPELEWAGAHSILGVGTACYHPYPLGEHGRVPGRQSRCLTQQQVISEGKLSHGRHTPVAERARFFCWGGLLIRSPIPLLPQ